MNGGLLIVHALLVINEREMAPHWDFLVNAVCDGITNSEDSNAGRMACGLVSDLSNYFEKDIQRSANSFLQRLNHVLDSNDFETETKIYALIAVGDLCLAISEGFLQFLNPTMRTLMSAAELTLKVTNFDSSEMTSRLRDAIIDAFISILHGMQPVCSAGSD